MTRCTRDLRTHPWRNIEHMALSLHDVEGFYACFLVWECPWCQRRVWADGVLHASTPPLSPVAWEQATTDTRNPWQQQVELLGRQQRQHASVQAMIQQWTLQRGRS